MLEELVVEVPDLLDKDSVDRSVEMVLEELVEKSVAEAVG